MTETTPRSPTPTPTGEKPQSHPRSTRLTPLRARQLGIGALCLGFATALFPFLGHFLLEASTSLAVNLAAEGAVMLLVFSGAYLVALALLGMLAPLRYGGTRLLEISSPSGDREALEGDGDDDLGALRPPARYPMLPFAFALVAIIFGVSLVGNRVAGDIFSRQREVRYNTILRSANVDARRRIIRELAQSEFKAVVEAYTPILWRLSVAPAGEDGRGATPAAQTVQAEAAWALAEIAERMHKSVLILHSQGELQGWERAWLDAAKRDYGRASVSAFRSGGTHVLRPFFRFIVHIDADRAVELAEIYLNHPEPDPELLIDIAYLLSQSSSLQACDVLFRLTSSEDAPLRATATLSEARLLRMFQAEKNGDEIPESKRFNQRLAKELQSRDPERLCPAVESLQHLKDARYTSRLIAMFDDPELSALHCDEIAASDHLGRADILMAKEELTYKILRALAGISVGNDQVTTFLKRAIGRDDLPEHLRLEIEHVQKLIKDAEADGE